MNFTIGNLANAQFRVSASSGDYTIDAMVNVDGGKAVNNINDGYVRDAEGAEVATFSSWAVNQLNVSYNNVEDHMAEVSEAINSFCNSLRLQAPSMALTF